MDEWIIVGAVTSGIAAVASCIAAVGTIAGLFIAWWTAPPEGFRFVVTETAHASGQVSGRVQLRLLGSMVMNDPEVHVISATITRVENLTHFIDVRSPLTEIEFTYLESEASDARVEVHWVEASRRKPTRRAARIWIADGRPEYWQSRWFWPWHYSWRPGRVGRMRGGNPPGAREPSPHLA